eukprot:403343341
MEFHAMLMLDMYNVQGWTADRGLWSAIGFMQNNNQTFYDGVHCKLSSVTFNSTKDIAGMNCFDVYFNKTTFQMYTDTTINNVLNDNSKANTSYMAMAGSNHLMWMSHFQRNMITNDTTGQDSNITDGQQDFKFFTVYGTLKNSVIQEASTHILNNKIEKYISLIAVMGSYSIYSFIVRLSFIISISVIAILL